MEEAGEQITRHLLVRENQYTEEVRSNLNLSAVINGEERCEDYGSSVTGVLLFSSFIAVCGSLNYGLALKRSPIVAPPSATTDRLDELSVRPAAAKTARSYLIELKDIVRGWETNKSWIPKDRINEVLNSAEKFKKWLDDREVEQNKTPIYGAPVFTSDEVYDKLVDLQSKVSTVNRIPNPKPKIEKPAKNETDDAKSGNTSDSTSKSTEDASSESTGSSDGKASDEVKPEAGHDEL